MANSVPLSYSGIRTSRGGIEKFLFHFMEKLQEETAGYKFVAKTHRLAYGSSQ